MLHIVALVGIDGAGKTTQARLLAEWLTTQGAAALYLRNAAGRRWCNRLAVRLGLRDGDALFGRAGMLTIESVLRWWVIASGLRQARRTGSIAVMDRYAWCQYANIRARGARGERLARLLYRAFPTPELTCFLAVPPTLAHTRVEARGTDHEELAGLVAGDAAYRSMIEEGNFAVIDASGSVEVVAQRLRAVVVDRRVWRSPGAPATP